jgi:hypothetical protein
MNSFQCQDRAKKGSSESGWLIYIVYIVFRLTVDSERNIVDFSISVRALFSLVLIGIRVEKSSHGRANVRRFPRSY